VLDAASSTALVSDRAAIAASAVEIALLPMELPLLRKLSFVQLLSVPAQGADAASARPPIGLLKPTGSLISSFCGIEPSLLPAKLLFLMLVMLGLFLLASLLLILKLPLDELLPGLQLLFFACCCFWWGCSCCLWGFSC
jgi:hypothetical protein